MVDFSCLYPGYIVRYTQHPDTNPDYFGREAVVASISDDCRYVKLNVERAKTPGSMFTATIYDPSRLEFVSTGINSNNDELDAMFNEIG